MQRKISCLPVSLFDAFFSGRRTIAQWSAQAVKLGLDSVDIHALFMRERTLAEVEQIRRELTLPVCMVSTYSDFTNPDAAQREMAKTVAERDMQRAAAIGAKYIRMTAGQGYPGQKDEETIRWVYDGFAHCAELSSKYGVGILMENHAKPGAWQYPDFNFDMDRFLALWDALKELPVSVNFDTANAYALHDWKRVLEAVKGRIATIHLNDLETVEPLKFALVGEGIAPLQEMVQAVTDTGFDGCICIEEAGYQGWEGMKKAAAFARNLAENLY